MFHDLYDLYQDLILDHDKNPRNFCRLEDHTHHAFGNNPLCGDELEIFIKIADDKVSEITFLGQGCAISLFP